MDRDQQFEIFLEAYPAARRQRGYIVQLFLAALEHVSLDVLLRAVEQHKRSEQWQGGRMIPSMEKWLSEQRWIQVLPEPEIPQSRLTPFERARRAGLK